MARGGPKSDLVSIKCRRYTTKRACKDDRDCIYNKKGDKCIKDA